MLKYIIKRLFAVIPMLLLITVLVFIGLDMTPGDPLSRMITPDQIMSMSTDQLDALRESLGLNKPLYIRYVKWLGGIFEGDFGISIVNGTPILQMVRNRLPATLELCLAGLAISTVLGLLFGLFASVKKDTFVDYSCTALGVAGLSIPDFFVGLVAITIFAIKLKILPAGGRLVYGASFWGRLPNLIMPACVMGFALTAALMRYTRGSMLDVLNKDYIKTARSKGLPEHTVIIRHAFRNALMPVVLLLCFRLPILIGGSVIIESMFGWGGMGTMITSAISGKDYPVVMFAVMCTATMVLIASVLVDIFTAMLDPRVRMES